MKNEIKTVGYSLNLAKHVSAEPVNHVEHHGQGSSTRRSNCVELRLSRGSNMVETQVFTREAALELILVLAAAVKAGESPAENNSKTS